MRIENFTSVLALGPFGTLHLAEETHWVPSYRFYHDLQSFAFAYTIQELWIERTRSSLQIDSHGNNWNSVLTAVPNLRTLRLRLAKGIKEVLEALTPDPSSQAPSPVICKDLTTLCLSDLNESGGYETLQRCAQLRSAHGHPLSHVCTALGGGQEPRAVKRPAGALDQDDTQSLPSFVEVKDECNLWRASERKFKEVMAQEVM